MGSLLLRENKAKSDAHNAHDAALRKPMAFRIQGVLLLNQKFSAARAS
jgi:hypothetical protein